MGTFLRFLIDSLTSDGRHLHSFAQLDKWNKMAPLPIKSEMCANAFDVFMAAFFTLLPSWSCSHASPPCQILASSPHFKARRETGASLLDNTNLTLAFHLPFILPPLFLLYCHLSEEDRAKSELY